MYKRQALNAAKEKNVTGKETTPFILKFIADATGGESLESNICLLYTSDAADERSSVDLGGRRIIKKNTKEDNVRRTLH